MSGAPDIDAEFTRLEAYVLSLENTRTDPPEPLINEVYELFVERDDNAPHQSPRLGIRHDGSTWPKNNLLGKGGNSQEGASLWRLVLLVDSPIRGNGMQGPRGAKVITKQLIDALTGFSVTDDEASPLSIISQIRYDPLDESVKPECGYYIEATNPSTNEN